MEPDDRGAPIKRDRDETGRARNARPRDGLGRPLPRGASGVPRQPEGVAREPEESIREAQRLLDEGMPFHAHEVLEDAWKTAPTATRPLWKGLAQLAVGVTHAARGNATGAGALLTRGAENIEAFQHDPPHGIDVAALVGWARDHAAAIESGGDRFPVLRLRPADEAPADVIAELLQLTPGFLPAERAWVIHRLAALGPSLRSIPGDRVELSISLVDRRGPRQRVSLECWISRTPRLHLVATSTARRLAAALDEVRDDLLNQVDAARTRIEARTDRARTVPR